MSKSAKAAIIGVLGLGIFVALRSCGAERAAVERVAEIEHEQWTAWSKGVAPEVSPERQARWRKLWVPYSALPEAEKEKDREWARRALEAAVRR
jgi:hypothetical protein